MGAGRCAWSRTATPRWRGPLMKEPDHAQHRNVHGSSADTALISIVLPSPRRALVSTYLGFCVGEGCTGVRRGARGAPSPSTPLPRGERGAGEQKGHRVKEINAHGE